MNKQMIRRAAAGACLLAGLPTMAHDGHGLTGGHWHATDAWGLVGFALALAAAVWLTRGGK